VEGWLDKICARRERAERCFKEIWYYLVMRKCYNCREPVKGKKLLCKKCEGKKIKNTTGTLIIYHTV